MATDIRTLGSLAWQSVKALSTRTLKLKCRARTFLENFVAPFPENNKRNEVDAGCVAVDCGAGLGARMHGRHPKAISAMGGNAGASTKIHARKRRADLGFRFAGDSRGELPRGVSRSEPPGLIQRSGVRGRRTVFSGAHRLKFFEATHKQRQGSNNFARSALECDESSHRFQSGAPAAHPLFMRSALGR